MDKQTIATEALQRARNGQSVGNFAAIFEGFAEKGIAPDDIKPRENVLTFHAWRALGRTVKRGEHGVKVYTFIDTSKIDEATGEETTGRRPRAATVFHVSQTEERQPPKPLTFCRFLAQDGVQDQTGELKAMDAHLWHRGKPGVRRLLRSNGLAPDYAREQAAEAGYLPTDSTLADFYDLIGRELRGQDCYRAADLSEAIELETAQGEEDSRHALELEAERLGIPSSMVQAASDDQLAELLGNLNGARQAAE